MSLREIVGCISSVRKEVTDFEGMNEPINKAVNDFIRKLQQCSVKNPIGEDHAFWYIENVPKTDLVRLRYGISNYGTISRSMESGSDLEWSLYNLVKVIDQYCRGNEVGWEYFVIPNGTNFFRGLAVLFTSGVGVFGEDPVSYAKSNCSLVFKEWVANEVKPLSLLRSYIDETDIDDVDGYIYRDIIDLLSRDNTHTALSKYDGVLELETYRRLQYAFHINGEKYVLTVTY